MILDIETKKAIEYLYCEMYTRLCIYALNALNDVSLAEEAVQDTFRIACMKSDSLMESQNRQGWLTNTLKNVIRNMRRSQARLNSIITAALSLDNLSPELSDDNSDFELYCTLVLGKDDHTLLKRIVIDKCTMLDVSKEFGISVEACKKRVQRAKRKLKKSITENL